MRPGAARADSCQSAEQRREVFGQGRIEIAARRDSDDALVTIRDSGDGIAPEQLDKLFQILTRGERSARRNQSGLGTGECGAASMRASRAWASNRWI